MTTAQTASFRISLLQIHLLLKNTSVTLTAQNTHSRCLD